MSGRRFTTIEQAQAELDTWVAHYNGEREHQAIGDVPPIRRFELVQRVPAEVIDPDVSEQGRLPAAPSHARSIALGGSASSSTAITWDGTWPASALVVLVRRRAAARHPRWVLVATHARRHLEEDDDRMDRQAKASRPARPTPGGEVLRKVDPSGSISFAGSGYRVGNRHVGQIVGVRVVADTVQSTQDGRL